MEQQEQNIRRRPRTSCESGAEQKLANKNVLKLGNKSQKLGRSSRRGRGAGVGGAGKQQ